MATNVQVRCIKKTNRQSRHERIHGIGGLNADGSTWKLTQSDAIRGIQDGRWSFYTYSNGITARVEVAYHNGIPYLKTNADTILTDNLLALPECP